MIYIYLIRHGETVYNRKHIAQGFSNSELTERGKKVVKRRGIQLSRIKFREVYTSDLSRTFKTAEIILNENLRTDKNIQINKLEQLREINFGYLEGKSDLFFPKYYLKNQKLRNVISDLNSNDDVVHFINRISSFDDTGDAENYEQFSSRASSAFLKVACAEFQKGNGNILMVSHGMFMRVIMRELGLNHKNRIKNADLVKIKFDGEKFEQIDWQAKRG